ncbi:hypothetical protein KR093_003285, partial [Drosophila rubida]
VPTVKFGKLSVMVWRCISSKRVDEMRILTENMNKEFYLDILRNELTKSAQNFGFIEPHFPHKLKYKSYQYKDPKHKSSLCMTGLLYNCST